jgi:hypothetical protein
MKDDLTTNTAHPIATSLLIMQKNLIRIKICKSYELPKYYELVHLGSKLYVYQVTNHTPHRFSYAPDHYHASCNSEAFTNFTRGRFHIQSAYRQIIQTVALLISTKFSLSKNSNCWGCDIFGRWE